MSGCNAAILAVFIVLIAGYTNAQEQSPAPGATFKDCSDCPEMVVIPQGNFVMGSPNAEAGRNSWEGPQHTVTISVPLAVASHEITFAQWDNCLADGGCGGYRPNDFGNGREKHPVSFVSWDDAQSYVVWLSRKTGKQYRLLSEAEWEYAARAGTQTPYWWGADANAVCGFENTGDASMKKQFPKTPDANLMKCDDGNALAAPVGSYKPNPFGLYDMLGNVNEWVQDCERTTYTGALTDGAAVQGNCTSRMLRGGNYANGSQNGAHFRSAERSSGPAKARGTQIGFRIARPL